MTHPVLSGLYLIAGSGLSVDAAETWLLPGVALVQYRNKHADKATRLKEATLLAALCRERSTCFIVNDDTELAAQAGADGVHLGKDDMEIAQARCILGENAVIGVSCYNSLERALKAQSASADYIAFGALFASTTKPEAARITLQDFANYKRQLSLPACAIGGITRNNLDSVLAVGADMIAVNADIATTLNPADTIKDYLTQIAK